MNDHASQQSAAHAAPLRPAPVAQPVAAQPVAVLPPETPLPAPPQSVRIYHHSPLVYWWPLWVVGYACAALTYWWGQPHLIGADREWYYPSSNPGVIFFLTLFLVILITNTTVRGLASGLVVMGGILTTLLLTYFDWWDPILNWFGDLNIHLNLGAYFWFSTLLFLAWALSTFVVDRLSYWQVTPGQISHEFVLGAGSKSYDTRGMVIEKRRSDLFQNWLLGLGSGNLVIRISGASQEEIEVPNVLFVGWKLDAVQRLAALDSAVVA